MAKRFSNKKGMIHNSKILFLSALIVILLIVGWFLYPDRANSGPYLDSAHGNSTYGVLRTSLSTTPNNYGQGNCAHCHEQHASIGGSEPAPNSPAGPDFYLLFYDLWLSPIQSIVFCYGCHMGTGSYQSGILQNYSYSYRRGGDTSLICPSSVRESFQFIQSDGTSQLNCGSSVGSSHKLGDFAILRDRWGFSDIQAEVNPCSACHNPHKAKRDFPCSLPNAHTDIYAWDVWGDDSTERMRNKAVSLGGTYCAPYRYNSTTTREPDNCSAPSTDCSTDCSNGSNLVDYVSLCTDCHNTTNLISSTRLGRYLYRIGWSAGGDFHGGRQRIDNGGDFSGTGEYGDLSEPYKSGGMPNYVLSCTDCHEPHGSPNEFLLRQTINGTPVGTDHGPISGGKWFYWCQACHVDIIVPQSHFIDETTNCFQAGSCHRHCDVSNCSPQLLLF